MKKNRILFIIVVSIIIFIGLLVTQGYLVYNAIKLGESSLQNKVNSAMENVISQHESLACNASKQFETSGRHSSRHLPYAESLNVLFIKELEHLPWASNVNDSLLNANLSQLHIHIQKSKNDGLEKQIIPVETKWAEQTKQMYIRPIITFDEQVSEEKRELILSKMENALKQNLSIRKMYPELFSNTKQNLAKPDDFSIFDSLIAAEFNHKDIRLAYEFGVYSSSKKKFVFFNNQKAYKNLLKKSLIYSICPHQVRSNGDYLMIRLPYQSEYLLKKNISLILITALLFFSALAMFLVLINTIFKQKKISDIKNDFINNMTHEFKTPISTVSLCCQVLSDKNLPLLQEQKDNYIQIIRQENQRLGNLAEKILQSASLDKAEFVLKKEETDIHELLQKAVENAGVLVHIKDGEIYTDYKAKQSLILVDKDHLFNALHNLLDNANKYSPKKPEIIVSTFDTNKGIGISIKDNGIGISKSYQKKIFEKLFRVPTGDVHDIKGFGLGLSYVKSVVDKHNGSISVESEPGKGSIFTIVLPIVST